MRKKKRNAGRNARAPFSFLNEKLQLNVSLQKGEGIVDAVKMGALVAVGGVNAGTDQRVAHVVARADGDGGVGGVAVIDVHRIVECFLLRAADELVDELAVVGAAVVLGADGYLTLRAGDVVAHAAHVHGEQLDRVVRDAARAAVADLLVHGKEHVYAAFEPDVVVADPFGERQQRYDRSLVVKIAAFDVAGLRDAKARLERDRVAGQDAHFFDILLRFHVVVEHDLHVLVQVARLIRVGVDVHRGVAQLERALIRAVEARDDLHIFGLGVVHVQRHIRDGEAAVGLDVLHDRAERVGVGQKRERFALAAERDVHAALDEPARRIAHRAQRVAQVLLDLLGAAGGAVDPQHGMQLLADVRYILLFHGVSSLCIGGMNYFTMLLPKSKAGKKIGIFPIPVFLLHVL